ncbi:MAG: EVE domain-containing protein [Firmicutes bacterium]|nr:EVE domain-containing protein [Bacillota bacterium]
MKLNHYWLLKTEPDEFSWDDLVKEGESVWDGVKNPTALKNLSRMRPGDQVIIYHTGKEKAAVGLGRVTSEPFPDPVLHDPRRLVVKISPVRKIKPVSLASIKASGRFPGWELVRLPRLSVVPVSREQWEALIQWGDTV